MNRSSRNQGKNKYKIDDIAITQDQLTGRAGLILFVRYISSLGLFANLEAFLGGIGKTTKASVS